MLLSQLTTESSAKTQACYNKLPTTRVSAISCCGSTTLFMMKGRVILVQWSYPPKLSTR